MGLLVDLAGPLQFLRNWTERIFFLLECMIPLACKLEFIIGKKHKSQGKPSQGWDLLPWKTELNDIVSVRYTPNWTKCLGQLKQTNVEGVGEFGFFVYSIFPFDAKHVDGCKLLMFYILKTNLSCALPPYSIKY